MYMYRELCLYGSQQVNVIIEVEVRVEAALHQYLGAAMFDRLPYLFEKHPPGQYIGVLISLVPVKCAELTLVNTDVRVIYIPVYDKADISLRMESFPDIISHHSQAEKVGVFQKVETFFFRYTDSCVFDIMLPLKY